VVLGITHSVCSWPRRSVKPHLFPFFFFLSFLAHLVLKCNVAFFPRHLLFLFWCITNFVAATWRRLSTMMSLLRWRCTGTGTATQANSIQDSPVPVPVPMAFPFPTLVAWLAGCQATWRQNRLKFHSNNFILLINKS